MLEKEFQYYKDHQDELVKKHNGKTLVIKDSKIIGVYETREEAITESSKTLELGTFLVQLCSPGDSAYSQTFHSRVLYSR
jgi:hypothetical protein